MSRSVKRCPIAIVGVSALFPGSSDETGFWADILNGEDRMRDVPASHWLIEDYYDPDVRAPDKTYARRGAFLDPVAFDALAWGVPPSVVPATDTAQLLALIVAQRVLDDASRGQFSSMDRSRMSVILGVTSAQELVGAMTARLARPMWVKGLRDAGLPEDQVQLACERIAENLPTWQESTFPGLLGNVVAGRIANRLDLGGTNCVTDAACASSFAAIQMSANELILGDSDLVITGGVDTLNDIFMFMCFSKTPALSPSGDIRPFSDKADGTMLGEGLGMVALKRLADAERDGDRIYAVLHGVGTSSDGRAKSVYAPVPEGQARALTRAYELAGYGPRTVELVEAHGTGTKAGDAAEFEGLRQVFATAAPGHRQWCQLGSVKAQIGHTKAAAGAAGLFKVVMALHARVLPPTIKVDAPNPKLEIESSPFHLTTRSRPWVRASDHPRRASVSSFGFGGSNFHLTLSEYTGPGARAERLRVLDRELVVLTAGCADDLVRTALAHRALCSAPGYLRFLAFTTATAFDARFSHRLAIVAKDEAELADKLEQAARRIEASPHERFALPTGVCYGVGSPSGDVGLLFPGQGSQFLDMGTGLAQHFDAARAVWDRAADMDLGGEVSLHEVVFPKTAFDEETASAQLQRLTRTEWAQPAIFAASLSMLKMLRALGVEAPHVGGHSFGEVSALCAAGALTEADALRVARVRGQLMQAAARLPGAMTAATCDLGRAKALLHGAGSDVVIANHNGPAQVVLSGSCQAIEEIERHFAAHGIRCARLQVATAFHSPIVAGASAELTRELASVDIQIPGSATVYANATASVYPHDPDAVRRQLGEQLALPVRFVEMIEHMYARGVRSFVEVGPGSVLTGLVTRILEGRAHLATSLDKKGARGVGAFLQGVAELVADGRSLSLGALWSGYRRPDDPHARKQPKVVLELSGANYGKPYPPAGGAASLPPPNPNSIAPAAPMPAPAAPMPEPAPERAEREAVMTMSLPSVVPSYDPLDPPRSLANVRAEIAPRPLKAEPSVLGALESVRDQTSDTHALYVTRMHEAHLAFLNTMQATVTALQSLGAREPSAAVPVALATSSPNTEAAHSPATNGISAARTNGQSHGPQLPAPIAPATSGMSAAPRSNGQSHGPQLPAPIAKVAGSAGLHELMLRVVSEKTGYPVEMLELDMELESDLGIDSIKRVEILSAVQKATPALPEVDGATMSSLRTLREVVSYMEGLLGGSPAVVVGGAVPAAPAAAPRSNGQSHGPQLPAPIAKVAGSAGLHELMLRVVSEKTGYPVEMLELDMELESDLGIDSIKRVEILSAVQKATPALPEVDGATMSSLRTLREVVSYMEGLLGGSGQAPKAAVVAEAVRSPVPRRESSVALRPSDLARQAHVVVEAKARGLMQPRLLEGTIAITDDTTGIAPQLVALLRARGVRAALARDVPMDEVHGLIALDGLAPQANPEGASAVNLRVFSAARSIAQGRAPGLFVTVQDTGGHFGHDAFAALNAWSAGLTALVRSARLEWPDTSLKAIDLARAGRDPKDLAEALARELLEGGSELEVGLAANGRRVTLHSEPFSLEARRDLCVGPSDVIVASGGARGVTAATLIELGKHSGASFVLLGRTTLEAEPATLRGVTHDADLKRLLLSNAAQQGQKLSPRELGQRCASVRAQREIRETLTVLEAAGCRVRYAVVDVTDGAALSEMLRSVRESFGPITGLVHGAGVLADRLIADKTDAQFESVFRTKVGGLRALLEATAHDPLRLLLLFSSVAAHAGNRGQADYAMANEVLNKVALVESRRRGERCVVKSLGWGPWEGGMVDAALEAHFAALGVPLIPLERGARALVEELSGVSGRMVEVVLGGEGFANAREASQAPRVQA